MARRSIASPSSAAPARATTATASTSSGRRSTTSRSSPSPTPTRRAGPTPAKQARRRRTPTPTTATMLEKEKPQIVSVADRFLDQHRDMVVACAEAGASIFLEKPMARTLAEADEMVKACETHHVKLAIAHQTRYSPRVDARQGADRRRPARRRAGAARPRQGGQPRRRRGPDGARHAHLRPDAPPRRRRRVVLRAASCRAASRRRRPTCARAARAWGRSLGDHINATLRLRRGRAGARSARTRRGTAPGSRFALSVYGTKGVVQMNTGSLPAVWFCDDPSWMPGKSKAAWQEVTSAGAGQAGDAEGGGAGAGQRVDRQGPDRGDREGPPAAGQHVRRPGGAGDDPGGVRVAPAGRRRWSCR